jgi:hypothetical protein
MIPIAAWSLGVIILVQFLDTTPGHTPHTPPP